MFDFDTLMTVSDTTAVPYSFYKRGDDFILLVNAAGFDRSEISVDAKDSSIRVVGKMEERPFSDAEPFYEGFLKDFTMEFDFGRKINVVEATLADGVLAIYAEDASNYSTKIDIS